jgi:hypothetical protein
MKYRQCLTRGLTLIKLYVADVLKGLLSELQQRLAKDKVRSGLVIVSGGCAAVLCMLSACPARTCRRWRRPRPWRWRWRRPSFRAWRRWCARCLPSWSSGVGWTSTSSCLRTATTCTPTCAPASSRRCWQHPCSPTSRPPAPMSSPLYAHAHNGRVAPARAHVCACLPASFSLHGIDAGGVQPPRARVSGRARSVLRVLRA